ncbi:MAG: hypothetical protein P9L99_11235 [Candidatus Lernaella stagnicola]|nr:hypothetical protein [Candidatus Lernaella stagnicola]
MQRTKLELFLINLAGGVAVLGSYAYGLLTHPGRGNELWGGVPDGLQGVYGISMLLAAAGYLLFFFHVVVRMRPEEVKLFRGLPFRFFHVLFGMILLPSSLWMTLTFAYLDTPTTLLWLAVRLVLALVALGSLLMLIALAQLRRRAPDQFWWPSVLGAALFTFHTLVLDALLWPALFPV